jgi:hypothetical protein
MEPGMKILDAIDKEIQLRDKILLVLSQASIASDWVEGEVTRGLDEERQRKQPVLLPIRIDDSVMKTNEPWARLLQGQRHIGDFTKWEEHHTYNQAIQNLLRALRNRNQRFTATPSAQPASPFTRPIAGISRRQAAGSAREPKDKRAL